MTRGARLPAGIWALGFVSLFMDISSEMIHSLLPVFLVTVVGASAATLGWIEGAAEAAASFLKLLSGAWSDRMRRRKPLALLGYALAAASKPLFPLADSAATVFAARLIDRTGKGIRGAPRDALVADLSDGSQRGAAYGLRQSLDTVGAVAGPLLAIALMGLFAGDMRDVFAVAVIPALLSVAILAFAVREPPVSRGVSRTASGSSRPANGRGWGPAHRLREFPAPFWLLMLALVPFTLARFSEAFLILRAENVGLAMTWVPLVLVAMNVSYAASAYPAGALSDRLPRARLLMLGCVVMAAADACLAFGGSLAWVFAGTLLWGLHMGLTEGLIAALVADYAPPSLLGSAFGIMHALRGVLLLAASALAGGLWAGFGAATAFAAGAVFSLLAAALLYFLNQRKQ